MGRLLTQRSTSQKLFVRCQTVLKVIFFICSNFLSIFCLDENGLCPSWSNEKFVFNLTYPELCLLRFVIYHRDTFDEKSLVGQATFPVSCIRQGFRSIRMNNEYTESSELSTLLVHIHIQSFKVKSASVSFHLFNII